MDVSVPELMLMSPTEFATVLTWTLGVAVSNAPRVPPAMFNCALLAVVPTKMREVLLDAGVIAPPVGSISVPAATLVVPVYVLVPVREVMPDPNCTTAPVPEIALGTEKFVERLNCRVPFTTTGPVPNAPVVPAAESVLFVPPRLSTVLPLEPIVVVPL